MPGFRVVDCGVQGEIVGVKAQFIQLVSGDQQMEW